MPTVLIRTRNRVMMTIHPIAYHAYNKSMTDTLPFASLNVPMFP
jgi:hypothetical protein